MTNADLPPEDDHSYDHDWDPDVTPPEDEEEHVCQPDEPDGQYGFRCRCGKPVRLS